MNNPKIVLLKQYFGHDEFRVGQEELIDCVLKVEIVLE
jgi:superfamily II DNA helicase RecQ